jgi:hypothetical protein
MSVSCPFWRRLSFGTPRCEGNETKSRAAERRVWEQQREKSWVPLYIQEGLRLRGHGTEIPFLSFLIMQLRNMDTICIVAAFPLALILLGVAYGPFLFGWL